jgi:hypothetical protein
MQEIDVDIDITDPLFTIKDLNMFRYTSIPFDLPYNIVMSSPGIKMRISRVFHFEVSISTSRLDLGSKSQEILTFARARSFWDFQPLGAKARAMPVDFFDALDVKPVR